MLAYAQGLSADQLEAIAELEARVVAADGGRLKLEWAILRSRPAGEVRDLLWWRGERLLGFLGVYGFGWNAQELAGMVDPEARRRGIGTALLAAALPIARGGESRRVLLVVPRNGGGGDRFALARDGLLEHSEHAMLLSERPQTGASDASLALRQAVSEDRQLLSDLFEDGFGEPIAAESPLSLLTERTQTLVVERGSVPVGTAAVTLDGDRGSIYGLVVHSRWRGQGIGREVLLRLCRRLWDRGARSVRLEVELTNERALGLYTSVGFAPVVTEDYYELPRGITQGGSEANDISLSP